MTVATLNVVSEKPVTVLEIKRVVDLLKGRGDQLTMTAIAVKLGVKPGTLYSWLRGDTQPGSAPTNMLRRLLLDCPLTWDERREIQERAHSALALGEVQIEPVMNQEAAEGRVKSGKADTWGEKEPERYRFLGHHGAMGPRRFVVYRFVDRELAAEVTKLPGSLTFKLPPRWQ